MWCPTFLLVVGCTFWKLFLTHPTRIPLSGRSIGCQKTLTEGLTDDLVHLWCNVNTCRIVHFTCALLGLLIFHHLMGALPLLRALSNSAPELRSVCMYRSPVKEWQVSWFVLGKISLNDTDSTVKLLYRNVKTLSAESSAIFANSGVCVIQSYWPQNNSADLPLFYWRGVRSDTR